MSGTGLAAAIGLGCLIALVYVGLGLLASRRVMERLRRHVRSTGRTTPMLEWLGEARAGRALAVLLWPVLSAFVELGFVLGWWDWKGERS